MKKKAIGLSGSTLKVIALLSMFCDHGAKFFLRYFDFTWTPFFTMGGSDDGGVPGGCAHGAIQWEAGVHSWSLGEISVLRDLSSASVGVVRHAMVVGHRLGGITAWLKKAE